MTQGHNMRLFWRVVKWSVSLLLCIICGILLWRVFSSGDPKEVKYLMGNDALYEAYEEKGKDLVLQYQMQDTITLAEYNRGYFTTVFKGSFRYGNRSVLHPAFATTIGINL